MKIEAATLAGGEVNQDYYAYGEAYALVLDGASSFLLDKSSIDAATYVKNLGEFLSVQLENCPLDGITEAVVSAIEKVTEKFELDEESSPNSTVVIAKWDQEKVVTYVLGDSACVVVDVCGEKTEITDNRMAKFGDEIREEYRRRLSVGFGFDLEHKKLLNQLQQHQKKYRNTIGGYWVAGANVNAAYEGILKIHSLKEVKSILLCSDGGYQSLVSFYQKDKNKKPDLLQVIQERHWAEENDNDGKAMPRSKVHDDKTIVNLTIEKL